MRVTAVLGRLRPDRVLPPARRDRVRHQGDPARRLHPDRRDDPAGRGGREQARRPAMRSFIAEVRGQALNDVAARRRRPASSTRKPWWQRVIVMFAGPFHNLILAVVFFTVVLVGLGVPSVDHHRSLGARRASLPAASAGRPPATRRQRCDRATPRRAPAATAGLRPGDTIVAIDGTPVDRAYDQLDAGPGRDPRQRRHAGRAHRRARRRRGRTSRSRRSRTPSTPTRPASDDDRPRRLSSASARRRPTSGSRSPPCPASSATIVVAVGRQARRRSRSRSRSCSARRSSAQQRDPNGPIGVVGVSRISGEVFALRPVQRPPRRSATSSSCSPA